jgi:hypothetical protein
MRSRLSGWVFACLGFVPLLGIIPAIVAYNLGKEDDVNGQKYLGVAGIILNLAALVFALIDM